MTPAEIELRNITFTAIIGLTVGVVLKMKGDPRGAGIMTSVVVMLVATEIRMVERT